MDLAKQLTHGEYGNAELIKMLYGEWTTELPKNDGYYWVNAKIGSTTIRLITYIIVIDGLPYDGVNRRHPTRNGLEVVTHWLGPLPEPEAPEQKGEK